MSVREIKFEEERFVSVKDLKRELAQNSNLLFGAAAVMKVAHEKNDPIEEQLRKMVGMWLASAIGDVEPIDNKD